MNKIFSTLTLALLASVGTGYAQYASDGLRFSQTNYGSTARFKALGNAQIGVGGDVSSLGGNPAGLGLFTKTEFSLTPEFNNSKVDANYLSTNTTAQKNQLNINQLAAVFYTPTYRFKGQDPKQGVVSAVFGLGLMRNNDYGLETSYSANNNINSIRNFFAELANSKRIGSNTISKSTLEGMAYHSYLINYNTPGDSALYTANSTGNPFTPNQQDRNEIRNGGVSEFNFAAAINIGNQVYIGANVGLINLRYISDTEFIERGKLNPYDQNNGYTGIEDYELSYSQNQETRGSGVNGRIGVIVKPSNYFRFGASLQSPTWFTIDDHYSEVLNNKLSNDVFKNDAAEYDFSYSLRTPLKGSIGTMFILGNKAMIAADLDFVDYSSIRFSTSGNSGGMTEINDSNTIVRKNYKSAINYRVGGEVKLNSFSLRAGYGLNGSPYKNDPTNMFDTQTYSGGFGYKFGNYSLDFAYQNIQSLSRISPYTLNNGTEPVAVSKISKNNFFFTLGLRF